MVLSMNRCCMKSHLGICVLHNALMYFSFSYYLSLSPHIYCTILFCVCGNYSTYVWVIAVLIAFLWGHIWYQAFSISFVRDCEFNQSTVMEAKNGESCDSRQNFRNCRLQWFWYRCYSWSRSVRIVVGRHWRLFWIIRWLVSARIF